MDQPSAPAADVDDDDLEPCYRHPGNLTALHCSNCERPICTDCSVAAPVGIKCPECGAMPRSARAAAPPQRVVAGTAAAALMAGVAGVLFGLISIPFFGWIIAWFVGGAIGYASVRAAGGFRDPLLTRLITVAVALGFLLPVGLSLLAIHGSPFHHVSIYPVIAAAAAAYGAYTRAS